MENEWLALWRELVLGFDKGNREGGRKTDVWERRAKRFDAAVKRKLSQPDPLRDFVLSHLYPDSTAIDIGAGTGSWTIPLAKATQRVVAVEPSETMASILQTNLAAEGLSNVDLVRGRWEDVEIEPCDIAVCSHAMYASPDLLGFVRKMEHAARRLCFLLVRVPSHNGVLGELSSTIHGRMHDSPNFIVAYNALLTAGVYANVMLEPVLKAWTNDDMDAAFQRAREHLRLGDDHSYDDHVRAVLAQKLVLQDGMYYWPDGMRSALVWWKTGS